MPRRVADKIYRREIAVPKFWSCTTDRRRKAEFFGRPHFYSEDALFGKCESFRILEKPKRKTAPLPIYVRAMAYSRELNSQNTLRQLRKSTKVHGVENSRITFDFLAARQAYEFFERENISRDRYEKSLRLCKDGQ